MDLDSFEKNAIFKWLKTIKTNLSNIEKSFEKMASNSQKQSDLLQKLLEMLENK